MDKNKIVTFLVLVIWIITEGLKFKSIINLGQYRIILLILVALYALFFYRNKIFKKK